MNKKVTTGIMIILLSTGMLALAFDIQPLGTESRISETNQNSSVIATYGRGYLENVSGLLILHVKGNPYEMGFQHGLLLRDRVQRSIQHLLYDVFIGQLGWTYDDMISISQAMEPYIPSEYIEEIQGMADGADVNYTDLLLVHTVPPWGCSSFAVFGNATVDHHLYFGKNLDGWVPPEPWYLVTIYEPDNGSAFVNAGHVGLCGVLTGMNENGIAISVHLSSSSDRTWDGIPYLALVRKVLQYSNNLVEACNLISQTDRTTGWTVVLGDGRNLNACAIEFSAHYCKVFWAGDAVEDVSPHYSIEDAVRRTNHFVDPELAATQRFPYDPRNDWNWSWNRYEKLGQLILACMHA